MEMKIQIWDGPGRFGFVNTKWKIFVLCDLNFVPWIIYSVFISLLKFIPLSLISEKSYTDWSMWSHWFFALIVLGSVRNLDATTESAALVDGASPGITGITVDKSVEFSYEELAKATDDFSMVNKIGEGGFGAVYYAELRGEVHTDPVLQWSSNNFLFVKLKSSLSHFKHWWTSLGTMAIHSIIGYTSENLYVFANLFPYR